jgi:hypothetical protein
MNAIVYEYDSKLFVPSYSYEYFAVQFEPSAPGAVKRKLYQPTLRLILKFFFKIKRNQPIARQILD